ncbi:MAG: hypothetical protein ABSE80_07605 [Halobacteriota archaeon]
MRLVAHDSAMGKNVMRVKLLVCLLFLALVSVMASFSKYLLLALIYAVAVISTDEFDRNALLDAVIEAQKRIPIAVQ